MQVEIKLKESDLGAALLEQGHLTTWTAVGWGGRKLVVSSWHPQFRRDQGNWTVKTIQRVGQGARVAWRWGDGPSCEHGIKAEATQVRKPVRYKDSLGNRRKPGCDKWVPHSPFQQSCTQCPCCSMHWVRGLRVEWWTRPVQSLPWIGLHPGGERDY